MDGDFARALLGVPRHASTDQVQHAFRRALRRAHPDVGGDATTCRALVEARECLLLTASAAPGPSVDTATRPSPTSQNPFTAAFTAPAAAHLDTTDRPRPAPVAGPGVAPPDRRFDDVLAAVLAAA